MDDLNSNGPYMRPYGSSGSNCQNGYVKPEFDINAAERTAVLEKRSDAGFATACFVLSLLGFLTGWMLIGLGLDIAAIVFAVICISGNHEGKGFAVAGLVISSISIIISVIIVFFAGMMLKGLFQGIPFFDSGSDGGYYNEQILPYYYYPEEEPGGIENF